MRVLTDHSHTTCRARHGQQEMDGSSLKNSLLILRKQCRLLYVASLRKQCRLLYVASLRLEN